MERELVDGTKPLKETIANVTHVFINVETSTGGPLESRIETLKQFLLYLPCRLSHAQHELLIGKQINKRLTFKRSTNPS